jgi:hypothetical protein
VFKIECVRGLPEQLLRVPLQLVLRVYDQDRKLLVEYIENTPLVNQFTIEKSNSWPVYHSYTIRKIPPWPSLVCEVKQIILLVFCFNLKIFKRSYLKKRAMGVTWDGRTVQY